MMIMERTPEELEWYMEHFASLIQICLDEHSNHLQYPYDVEIIVKKGRKYWKILIDEVDRDDHRFTSTRVFGFVRRQDGAIFRAANLKAPETRTKNPIRGYIWEEDAGNTFSWTGINYDMGT